MTLVKRNGSLFNPLPTFFDDWISKDLFTWGNKNFSVTETTIPAVNIKEKGDVYEVEMAAPGMKKEDFHVELDGSQLTISSSRREQASQQTQQSRYACREFSYQSFQRSFTLHKEVVDIDNIQARYEDGLLKLQIPKKEQARQKATRVIPIS